MLTQYEAEQLRQQMHEELNPTWTALVRCIAGLLIVLALALFARQFPLHHDPVAADHASSQPAGEAGAQTSSRATDGVVGTAGQVLEPEPVKHAEIGSSGASGSSIPEL